MAYGPVEPDVLVSGHGPTTFFECRDWEGVGKGEWGARFGFEEVEMGDTTVLVFVTSSLANVLRNRISFD